ncbi:gluconate 2-dehydrogenase subunit 3 family protein [Vibrio sp. CAIM 722]|uniref:Gluconate 2-dehydrogenase subunit 3 family protein n=1 Tax=Vibrio eleionomae TaxID=2653505 RepID=A0A7X4RTG6_9VIBR|nr:gluconate 2-dehydrogenase subunit 3 family protein [Vibrio eleionomae]MZI92197.1 gluconate 2-dehydrogenase subunit 3 family protein [Vibrio eleionomae]
MDRRHALKFLGRAASALAIAPHVVNAKEMHGVPLETAMNADHLPQPAQAGWQVLTDPKDRAALSAIFDRIIPADKYGPSATEAGCIEFLDDQLAGDYGSGKALYLEGPMDRKNEEMLMGKPQFLATPKERYMTGIKALEQYSQSHFGSSLDALSPDNMDQFLLNLEAGKIDLGKDVDGKALFELMIQNAREGYLSDPLYGGNRNMAGWKMIGFPGARYDYRPYLSRPGENLELIPVSLIPND